MQPNRRVYLTDRLTAESAIPILNEDDFYTHRPSGGVYLKDEARKRYFTEYEEYLRRPMTSSLDQSEVSYRELFRRQAERLRKAVAGEEPYISYTFSM